VLQAAGTGVLQGDEGNGRPALTRLLPAIEAGELDCVVVYKVDRLSRSLLDFTRMLSIFEKQNVSFVAVTQQFNTSASLGRLMLNILLSFAQFERELIGERTRDKILRSLWSQYRHGMWRFLAILKLHTY
jgi:site-specific DNA recombinase